MKSMTGNITDRILTVIIFGKSFMFNENRLTSSVTKEAGRDHLPITMQVTTEMIVSGTTSSTT